MALFFDLIQWRDRLPEPVPTILCFGDSWIHYPFHKDGNLTNRFLQFGKNQGFEIMALGQNGMEIGAPGKGNLYNLSTLLSFEKDTVQMIVISGGGNDFAGADDLLPLLKVGKPDDITSWFKVPETTALFARITRGYENVIHLRDTFCPNAPIVTHCYDYAPPTGKGLLGFSPWIRPALDQVGMPVELHGAAVRYIIDHLAIVQKEMELQHPPYHFVDTRESLQDNDWDNELHPTFSGFNKIASRFYPEFAKAFPHWVSKPAWVTTPQQ